MLTQQASTIVPQMQLVPTYPQHLISTLTPRQLRATLAGQQYYIDHQHGTYATHAQLCAFIKARCQRWQYTNASVEWQNHFIGGWHAALLNDPTAEQERPTVQTQEEPQPVAIQAQQARPLAGREDEEDRNKRQPQEGEPTGTGSTFPDEDQEDQNGTTAATVALLRRRIEQAITTIDQRRAAPMKAGEPTCPSYGEPTGPLFAQVRHIRQALAATRPTFDPESDDSLITHNVMQAQVNEPDPDQRRIIPIDFDGWLTILQCPGQRPEDDDEDGNPRPVILPPAPTSPTTGGATVVIALQQTQAHHRQEAAR